MVGRSALYHSRLIRVCSPGLRWRKKYLDNGRTGGALHVLLEVTRNLLLKQFGALYENRLVEPCVYTIDQHSTTGSRFKEDDKGGRGDELKLLIQSEYTFSFCSCCFASTRLKASFLMASFSSYMSILLH